ncbi:MAG TPA: zinc ABC transporter substrate-binding protein [Aeromicrobium sp.]|nr:zinc ABC transporter substrate-binding protein [Aeromicrobium sp.]
MASSTFARFGAPALLLTLLPAGCSGKSTQSTDGDGGVSIVASTNVYGDIAASIAGDEATVTSFITNPAQDPHEYEASAKDRLALDDADVVLKNGGGFDPFVDALLASGDAKPKVLNAVEISGLAPDEDRHAHVEGFNEHVWYNFGAMIKVAKTLGDELSELDPSHAREYATNVTAFTKSVDALERAEQRLKATAGGRGVAITEPVPMYLLEAVGLVNRTPEAFSEAVEEGADVSPRVLKETLGLFGGPKDIAVLAYNDQTADATTEQVRDAAEAAGVPVVAFTETLPHGKSYVAWQHGNLDRLTAALSKHG